MKRILALILLSLASTVFATDFHPADGKSATIQAIINCTTGCTPAPIASGDRIFIPDSSGEPGGAWVWDASLNPSNGGTGVRINKGFNIDLIGGDGTIGTRPIITGQTGMGRLLWYTAGDPTPRKTGHITNIEWLSDGDIHRVRIDGVSTYTVDSVTGAVTGGLRVNQCKFNNPYYGGVAGANPGRDVTGCTILASNLKQLVCTGGNFTQLDAGVIGSVPAAQARVVWDGPPHTVFPLHTRILTFINSTTVNLNQAAKVAVTTPTTFHLTGTTPNLLAAWIDWSGWVFGVVDHCEYFQNLVRVLSVHGDFANSSSPVNWSFPGNINGDGDQGDYAASFLPPGKQDIAGNLEGVYFEDNIFHFGSPAVNDCGSNAGTTAGGAILVWRHNTTLGSMATHGTRESGGVRFSARLMEYYNNHYLRWAPGNQGSDSNVYENSAGIGPVEDRDGEQLNYNDYMSANTGTNLINTLACLNAFSGGTDSNGAFTVSQDSGLYWGADGLNPLDKNQKGVFDFKGFHHLPYAGYPDHTQPNGNDIMKGYDAAHGIDSSDTVHSGIDSDSRFSDVYATVTGTYNPATINNFNGASVQWTPPSGLTTIPANYFAGFVMRNAGIRRGRPTQADPIAWKVIVSNTQEDASGHVNFVFRLSNPASGNNIPLNVANGPLEIRRVQVHFGVCGRGNMNPGFVPGLRPARLPSDCLAGNPVCSPGQNPYFTSDDQGGCWNWGNRKRTGLVGAPSTYADWSGSVTEGTLSDTFQTVYGVTRGFVYIKSFATDIHDTKIDLSYAGDKSVQPLFDKGYKWDHRVAAGSDTAKATRVGADWGKTFVDPVTGETEFSTIGPESPPLGSSSATINTITPEFASFYRPGVGGFTYPHPLVATAALAAPTITSASSTTFTAGVTSDCDAIPPVNCFTVRTTGNPNPSFTPAPTPKPPFMTFTDKGDGTGTMTGSPTAGTGPFNFKITAHNSVGDATQDPFTLTVISPTGVTLDSPLATDTFTAPASITLKATVTGTPGTVDFKNNTTGTTIGSDSTSPYSYSWSPVGAGSYPIKACVGSTCSAVTTITVSNPTPTPQPTPAQMSIRP